MAIKSGFDCEITLINPKKQVKWFSNIGFYEFCVEVANSNSFGEWSIKNDKPAWASKLDLKIHQCVIEEFLKEKGYQIIRRNQK